jgi:cytochrome c oxidase accessory protein FixG
MLQVKIHPDASEGLGFAESDGVAVSDAQATNTSARRNLYKSRIPIYPKLVHGNFRRLKWAVMIVTLGIYYLAPWLRWERGPGEPSQAILVDLTRQRFYFFFIEIWPQEVYYVTGLLVLAAVALFLFTALFGRVWCGYTCPQTVWTDLFIHVERLIEGDRSARIRLAAEPWNLSKLSKRVAKHVTWLLIGALTGGAWVFYFADAPTLAQGILHGTAPAIAYFFIAGLTFTTYALGGLMREQVCTYMCPWPRIQGAMMDAESLSVTYRTDRGEPRAPHKKGQSWEGRGHCIDCNQCVVACPMGIDIRDGAQLECINCALCIDACDEVMDKVGLPRGLIAYDTDANIARRRAGKKTSFRFLRPRTILYGVVLLIVATVMTVSLVTRGTMGLDALRDRNPDFVVLSDGAVRNGYTLKLLNHASSPQTYLLSISRLDIEKFNIIGIDADRWPVAISVKPDRVRMLRVLLTIPASARRDTPQPVTFTITNERTHESFSTPTVFVSKGG